MSLSSGAPRARLSAPDAAALARETSSLKVPRARTRWRTRARAVLDATRRLLAVRRPEGE